MTDVLWLVVVSLSVVADLWWYFRQVKEERDL